MKRYLIFALLFPPIAFVVAFWIMLQITNWAEGSPNTFDYRQVTVLPMAYMIAIIPALLTAKVDDVLFKRNMGYRVFWTAVAGFVLIFLPMLTPLTTRFLDGPNLFVFGIIGAVPAAICSWLAGYKQKESASA